MVIPCEQAEPPERQRHILFTADAGITHLTDGAMGVILSNAERMNSDQALSYGEER
jgi:hypothetical protein